MNIPLRKVYEVTGYTADADTWCIACATEWFGDLSDISRPAWYPFQDVRDSQGGTVEPIFLGTEWDYQPCCCQCHELIDATVIGIEE